MWHAYVLSTQNNAVGQFENKNKSFGQLVI